MAGLGTEKQGSATVCRTSPRSGESRTCRPRQSGEFGAEKVFSSSPILAVQFFVARIGVTGTLFRGIAWRFAFPSSGLLMKGPSMVVGGPSVEVARGESA